MSRRVFRGRVVMADFSAAVLLMLAGCFLLGAVAGHSAAAQDAIRQNQELQTYLQAFQVLLQEGKIEHVSLGYALISYCKYPALFFFLGFFSAGILLIPALMVYQGFSISFAVSAILYTAGDHGLLLALALLGAQCLVVFPCCFFLAGSSMSRSAHRAAKRHGKRTDSAFSKYTLLRIAFCAALPLAAAVLEHLYLAQWLRAIL